MRQFRHGLCTHCSLRMGLRWSFEVILFLCERLIMKIECVFEFTPGASSSQSARFVLRVGDQEVINGL